MVALSLLFLTELGLDEMIKEIAEEFNSDIQSTMEKLCPKMKEGDTEKWADVKGPDDRNYADFEHITNSEVWEKMRSKGKDVSTVPEFTNRRTGEPRPTKPMVMSTTNLKDYRSVCKDIFNIFPPKPWALQRDHFDRTTVDNQKTLALRWFNN